MQAQRTGMPIYLIAAGAARTSNKPVHSLAITREVLILTLVIYFALGDVFPDTSKGIIDERMFELYIPFLSSECCPFKKPTFF